MRTHQMADAGLYGLPSMAMRHTGKELYYSAHDKKAHGAALAYAALKWGKNIALEQGKILFHKASEIQQEQKRGWSR